MMTLPRLSPDVFLTFGLLLMSAGLLTLAGALLMRMFRQLRSERQIEQVLANRQQQALQAIAGGNSVSAASDNAEPAPKDRGWRGLFDRAAALGKRWSETRVGHYLLADEDRIILAQCGYDDARARSLFIFVRVATALLLPAAVWVWFRGNGDVDTAVRLIAGFGLGLLLPKFAIARRAAKRCEALVGELPLLIDLLRLLQGVGLSMDQSLYVIVSDFGGILPILSREFESANRQYSTGRSRELSLARLREVYDNDDLRALVRLIVQVERHGGAVQEPLAQFSERLREQRRHTMKERIGKLTVKMTLTMMLTLLPALLLVIAGPAILSLMHSMEKM
ncbi:pilus assembly protein TadC [Pandoraea terrae]|uniref:Pilus assembly protein TadC n=1 Tax=Pandoraea terrae TaxID=1537710 RepID=A0A5E4Z8Q1_9BURK|nr:type II secretion system F family protein [Pandoraea terrae]VVE56573.1 pilus assembly protein TadC [Pandoraea terrae]